MRKTFAFIFILTLTAAGFVKASDQVSMDTAALTVPMTQSSENVFRAVVTADGKLILKPGPVFTEGVEAEGTQLPYLISAPKPILYPGWALRQGWHGEFVIAVEILTDGTVGRYAVSQSTGHEILDEAATEAVRTWKFQPAMKDGKPMVSCFQIPIRFQINQQ